MKLEKIVGTLLMIVAGLGGINWGLYGLAQMDLISLLFSGFPFVPMILYIIMGLSGLYVFYKLLFGKKK